MKFFFEPDSIALIGASEKLWGSNLLDNIQLGYKGTVYPVNPRYEELKGLTCYPSVEEVPGPVDLAIILTSASEVPEILEACARKRVRGAIIESGGFAETGSKGAILQNRCREIAGRAGIRLWGPNCLGLVDIPGRNFFTFTFPSIFKSELLTSGVSLVVQSGALAGVFLPELMSRHGIGLSKLCSIGNKADVDECDVLEYLLQDEKTDVVAFYLESIPRGRLFLEMLTRSSKPVVVLKGGESETGIKAALSHTASIAGDARLSRSLLEASGACVAYDFHQMIDLALTLSLASGLPGNCRTAVLTLSGAASILSCDFLEKYGLTLASLSEDTILDLSTLLPPWMPVGHPVDLGPAIHPYQIAIERAAEILLKDPNVDALLSHYFFVEEIPFNLKKIKRCADREGKVLAFWGIGIQDEVMRFRKEAFRLGVPVYTELSRATECLAAAVKFRRSESAIRIASTPIPSPSEPARQREVDRATPVEIMDEFASKRILESWDIPVAKEHLVSSPEEARAAAEELGYPVVLKCLLPGIIHKSEEGLIKKDIFTPNQLEKIYTNFHKKPKGKGRIIIQSQLSIDYELIVGYIVDRQYGPCVMAGRGGLFAELEPDTAFALAPFDNNQACALMERIRAKRLFDGYRGLPPLDRSKMADLLVTISRTQTINPDITQIDLNPVAVCHGIPVVIDATIITLYRDKKIL